jgi:hypothetical protein
MKLSRRGMLGGLFGAGIAGPSIAKEMMITSRETYLSPKPWSPSTVPFSKQVMDAGHHHSTDAMAYSAGIGLDPTWSLRQNAMKAYVLATGKLPDWRIEELAEEARASRLHDDVMALRSVSQPARNMIMERRALQGRIKYEIDRVAFRDDRRRSWAEKVKGWWRAAGVPDAPSDGDGYINATD